jgi:hypothetical protein
VLFRSKFQVVFERAKLLLKELDNFLTKEYVRAKTVEKTFQFIEKLQVLEMQLQSLAGQRTRVESERTMIETGIAETHQRMADLKGKGGLDQLLKIDIETKALGNEARQSLQHLQKPFIKLQSLALHGEGSGLTPEEVTKLNQYIEDPFRALATEESGHPLLKQILEKMTRAISEGTLKLKPEKTRKAEQVAENILLQNILASLHEKGAKVIALQRQLSTSAEVTETEKSLSKLEEQLEGFERRKRTIEGEQITLERTCKETAEKIRNHKTEIEKNVLDFTSKRIQLG